jgi:MFS family permease
MRGKRHSVKRPSMELTRRRKFLIYTILVSTWSSGVLWLVLHYFLQRRGEFGVEPNPFEFWILALHGACAFAALWLAGWIWTTHILPWWHGQRRRNSGIVLIAFTGALILSGYLLYYASGDALREWIGVIHWCIGLAAAIPMLVHALRSWRYRATPLR